MWNDLWAALALWLILEGIPPFLGPARWRELLRGLTLLDDRSLRLIGMASMAMGLGLLFYVRS